MDALYSKHKSLMEYLRKKAGYSSAGFGRIGDLYDILYVENEQNKT